VFPGPLVSDADEDFPDPFVVEYDCGPHTPNRQEVPHYLLVIYAIVSWLHLQFNLPRVACNALLAFLARLLTFLNPGITPPFITLHSATRTLSVDSRIQWLAVCPKCRDVYPSTLSKYAQDTYTNCQIPLFLPDHTRRGSLRAVKLPVIKYPYLPLSAQIESLLKVPGVEAVLDEWRKRPRNLGEYGDIFDGEVCRLKLRAPDGTLFFSNLPHETTGPAGELRIGVNLGIDWYVLHLPRSRLIQPGPRFSYIHSNIAPSHSSCPTSFSVCNFPPEYRYVFLPHLLYRPLIFQVPHVKPLMHEHPPRPKGAGPR